MDSLFSSTLDMVAPLRLMKITEKRQTPSYNEHTGALQRAARKMERSWRKTKPYFIWLGGKDPYPTEKHSKTAIYDYFLYLLEENRHKSRYLFNTVAKKQQKKNIN